MVRYPDVYPTNSALFVFAVSTAYTSSLAGYIEDPYRPLPGGLTLVDLNFLNRDSSLFSVGSCLYSAGPALGSAKAAAKIDMVSDLANHHAEVVGDSGGFQIGQGHIVPVKPGNKPPPKKKAWKGKETLNNLATFAQNADFCPTLDFPRALLDLCDETGMPNIGPWLKHLQANGGVDPAVLIPGVPYLTLQQLCEQNGMSPEFNAALWYTIHNTEVLIRDPRISGKLWSVYQGKGNEEARAWVAAMAPYRLPGVCFAGPFLVRLEQVLDIITEDLAVGRFDHIRRLHFLGTGEMQNIVSYSVLQRCLRAETGHDIVITADAASPYLMAASGHVVIGFKLGTVDWTFMSADYAELAAMPADMVLEDALFELWAAQVSGDARESWSAPNDRTKQCCQHFFARTEISKRITVGDLMLAPDGRSERLGELMLKNHNSQVYLEGMVTAIFHFDAKTPGMVPSQLILHCEAVEKVFAAPPDQRKAVIRNSADELNLLTGLTAVANKRVRYLEGIDERWQPPAGYVLPKQKKARGAV